MTSASAAQHPADLLSARLDDELDPETAEEVDRHVDRCADCREELVDLERVRGILRDLPWEPAPASLVGDVITQRRRASRRAGSLGLVAAAAAIVTGLVFADPVDVSSAVAPGPRVAEKQERLAAETRPQRPSARTVRQAQDVAGSDSSLADRVEAAARDLLDFLG